MVNSHVVGMQKVSFGYSEEKILVDVSLTIHKGDFISIVGPNGGGKTTLLKLMIGLIKPDSGSVSILGKSPQASCSKIGYVPQHCNVDSKFPATVLDVVIMGTLDSSFKIGRASKTDKLIAMDALKKVKMEEYAKRSFSSLSGGQKQRVLIARSLASQPKILLLDEPTANLDPAVEEEIYTQLKELTNKITVVIVSHDLSFVTSHTDRVVCVNKTVHVHPAVEITGEVMHGMFGRNLSVVRHDKHSCDNCPGCNQ